MKAKLLFPLAAVAVLVASLAINLSTKTSASNVNLAELVQTASADEYWTFTICVDPYHGRSWFLHEPHWWLGAMYDVPVDYVSHPVECCLAGGMDPCGIPTHVEDIFDGYDPLGKPIKRPANGRWVGGQDVNLNRTPSMPWLPGEFDIVRTLPGGSGGPIHQVRGDGWL